MKPFAFFKFLFVVVATTMFLSSCGEDIIETPVPPNIKFNEVLGYISSDSDVTLGGSFSVSISGVKGTSPMKTITVDEDGTNIDLSSNRITFVSGVGGANPALLLLENKNSFDYVVTIKAHTIFGIKTYNFKVADEAGNISTLSLKINVIGASVNMLEGILLNQSGPTGQGGLDLDTGAGTGSADTKADIRDEGVVNVIDDGTWKQQISGVNGSVIKYIKKGQNGIAETFAFSNIKYKEEISPLWANGIAFNQKSTDEQKELSAKVEKGDIFIVKNGEKYYLITVKDIKITPETTGDDRNKDSYTFDVKF
ncbi:MAG: hypothetical protein IPN86_04635 [Saprospiraceae bacterium]|nr:hypothetical protein [Saprospiraceae bacterium]